MTLFEDFADPYATGKVSDLQMRNIRLPGEVNPERTSVDVGHRWKAALRAKLVVQEQIFRASRAGNDI